MLMAIQHALPNTDMHCVRTLAALQGCSKESISKTTRGAWNGMRRNVQAELMKDAQEHLLVKLHSAWRQLVKE